ncbi:hypothetical protein [Ovoidimarina sediminis]|uniref:hypothetical protein n=1 Tax=Ovoidimarina sediminis TaxID=3079856 RepID=UPI0029105A6F|nr:hypothetical protein [Rhodophyticola sp. MJ-SS7]MDU8946282.1 hypothetical protein [Rhodophyticola sp. MJ-SS7]
MRDMKHIALLAPICVLAFANPALAFNWGFVRVPDWMDPWLLLLVILQAPFWIVALRYKPRGVSLMQMDKTGLPAFARLSITLVTILFAALMLMIFIGMGLARM